MARQEGFEPPAYGLEVRCSIQLSYWRLNNADGDRQGLVSSMLIKDLQRILSRLTLLEVPANPDPSDRQPHPRKSLQQIGRRNH